MNGVRASVDRATETPGRFAQQASLSLIGNVTYSAGQWLSVVALSRSLGLFAVGQVSFSLSIISPVLLFFSLNLRTIVAGDVNEGRRLREYAVVRALSLFCAFLVVMGLGLFIGLTPPMFWVFVLMFVARGADLAVDVLYGSLQRANMNGTIGLSLVAHGVIPLMLAVSLLVFSSTVVAFTAGLAIGSVLAVVLVDLPLATKTAGPAMSPVMKSEGLRGLLKPFLRGASTSRNRALAASLVPFGFVALLGSLYQNVPRYFLAGNGGALAIGQFTSLLYLTFVPFTLVGAVAGVATPSLSSAAAESGPRFFRLMLGLGMLAVLSGLALLVAGVIAGPVLERAIYGQVISPSANARAWMLATATPWYLASVLSIAATALRETQLQLVGHVTATLVTLVGCLLLSHDYGVAGVGAALFAGLAALAVIELYAVRRAVLRARKG